MVQDTRIGMLSLTMAVPRETMPEFLRNKMGQVPPVLLLEEVRGQDPATRMQVLAVVERAITHYREDAHQYRNRGSSPEFIAAALELFLERARA